MLVGNVKFKPVKETNLGMTCPMSFENQYSVLAELLGCRKIEVWYSNENKKSYI